MAPSFAKVKNLSSLVLDGFCNGFTRCPRRGYAVASQSGRKASMGEKKSGEEKGVSTYKVSWVPDPVTGYYKPENINDIDAAELRAMLLTKKFNNN